MKKQSQIINNVEQFNNLIIQPIKDVFGDVEWLKDDGLMNFNKIFFMLDLYYGDRYIGFDNDEIFIKKLKFKLSDLLPDLYYKQQLFLQENLASFLKDYKNRAIKYVDEGTSAKDSKNRSNTGNSSAPVNKIITDPMELSDIPLTQATLNSMEFLENYNTKNERTSINFLNNIKSNWNTDFTLHIEEWLNHLKGLYANIIIDYVDEENEPKYYRFMNGYNVYEVDYLGTENKNRLDQQLSLINKNIDNINIINGNFNNYYTKLETEQEIEEAISQISQPDLSEYAKKNEPNVFSQRNSFNDIYIQGIAGIYFDNDNTAKMTFDNESLNFSYITDNINLKDNSIVLFKQMKEYVLNNSPQPDLSNVLLKNQTNTITTDKLLTTTNQNNTIFESINNIEKKMYFDFIQQKGGYRNWNHLIFRAKLGTNDYENILDVYSKDVGSGLWLNVGNNKINFDSETLIGGVATPVGNNDVANKKYVDTQIANIPQPQEINLVENVETAIPNYKINNKQVYQKYCTSDDEVKAIFSIADYMTMWGLVSKGSNYMKNCPWYYNSSEVYMIDEQSSGGLYSRGFNTTGHKIVVEYTKK